MNLSREKKNWCHDNILNEISTFYIVEMDIIITHWFVEAAFSMTMKAFHWSKFYNWIKLAFDEHVNKSVCLNLPIKSMTLGQYILQFDDSFHIDWNLKHIIVGIWITITKMTLTVQHNLA